MADTEEIAWHDTSSDFLRECMRYPKPATKAMNKWNLLDDNLFSPLSVYARYIHTFKWKSGKLNEWNDLRYAFHYIENFY